MAKSPSKYHAQKVETEDGTFDSKHEYERWCELKLMQRAGKIRSLQRQVKFVLIPTQRSEAVLGPRGGIKTPSKVLEHECAYFADFTYIDRDTGECVVEDAKGMRTPDYIIKRKLMLWVHNIRVKEV